MLLQAIFGTIPYGEYKEDSRVMCLMSDGVPPYELKRDETRFLLVPTELLTRCWAMDPDTRPTAKDLTSTFRNCLLDRYSTAKHLKDSLVCSIHTEYESKFLTVGAGGLILDFELNRRGDLLS